MKLYILLSAILQTVVSVYIIFTPSLNLNTYTVNTGVEYSIWTPISIFGGTLNVQSGADFFVSSIANSNGLSVQFEDWIGVSVRQLVNDGTVLFSAKGPTTSPTCNIIVGVFRNSGTIFFQNESTRFRPTVSISAPNFSNTGFMVFYESYQPNSNVLLQGNGGTLQNNGDICLYNKDYYQQSLIGAYGCIHLQGSSVFYFLHPEYDLSGQTIYMEGQSSSIYLATNSIPLSYLCTVLGFGIGNQIRVSGSIINMNYNAATGTLDFGISYSGFTSMTSFNIGLNYIPSFFQIIPVSYAINAITYTGPHPSLLVPSVCRPCPSVPVAQILASIPQFTTYTTTVTIINNSETLTSTGVVEMGTASGGSPFTTTSFFPPDPTSSEISSTISESSGRSILSPSIFSSSIQSSSVEPSSIESRSIKSSSVQSSPSVISHSSLESTTVQPSSIESSSSVKFSSVESSSIKISIGTSSIVENSSPPQSSNLLSPPSDSMSTSAESFTPASSFIDDATITVSGHIKSIPPNLSSFDIQSTKESTSSTFSISSYSNNSADSFWSSGDDGLVETSVDTNIISRISTTSKSVIDTAVEITTETKWLTRYTTLCVTTIDGIVVTETGIVKVCTTANGIKYTTTSIIKPTTAPSICTTLCTTQDSNDAQISYFAVIEVGNTKGTPYSKSLIIATTTRSETEIINGVSAIIGDISIIDTNTPTINPELPNTIKTSSPIISIPTIDNFSNGSKVSYINSILVLVSILLCCI